MSDSEEGDGYTPRERQQIVRELWEQWHSTAGAIDHLPPDQIIEHLSAKRTTTYQQFNRDYPKTPRVAVLRRTDTSHAAARCIPSLPNDLIGAILSHLDFRSLARLSATSLRNKLTVEALPAYRDPMLHTPSTLALLARTGLIDAHPASKLYEALRSSRCVSCGECGPYLNFITWERSCDLCNTLRPSLHCIPSATAMAAFRLESRHIEEMPVLKNARHIAPYLASGAGYRLPAEEYVSVELAKAMALGIWADGLLDGSIPEPPRMSQQAADTWRVTRIYRDAPLGPLEKSLLRTTQDNGKPRTRRDLALASMSFAATLSFPSLFSSGRLDEGGYLCAGCETFLNFGHMTPGAGSLPYPETETTFFFAEMVMFARTRSDFIEHAKQCLGVRWLLVDQKVLGRYASLRRNWLSNYGKRRPAAGLRKLMGKQ